eukprot:768850-Pyramimonas_sp.AAC.1
MTSSREAEYRIFEIRRLWRMSRARRTYSGKPTRARTGTAASLILRAHTRSDWHPANMCAHGVQSLGVPGCPD